MLYCKSRSWSNVAPTGNVGADSKAWDRKYHVDHFASGLNYAVILQAFMKRTMYGKWGK
jgi:hypothetical protein